MTIWPTRARAHSEPLAAAFPPSGPPPLGLLQSLRAYRRDRRGNALVEFAFIGPIVILFLLGVLEFGYFLWNRHSLEIAVEETGRMVLTQQTVTDEAVTSDFKSRLLAIDPAAVTANVTRETIGVTTFVLLTAKYTYSYVFAGYLGLSPIEITSVMRVPLRQTD